MRFREEKENSPTSTINQPTSLKTYANSRSHFLAVAVKINIIDFISSRHNFLSKAKYPRLRLPEYSYGRREGKNRESLPIIIKTMPFKGTGSDGDPSNNFHFISLNHFCAIRRLG